ncbi:hypothetical protein COJ42_16235 [Bacillus cereus]|nr:hypothetical protein CN464_11525 [Bacillus cereus]PFM32546.1 hypothetical protein COJ42_16235 [Bacillus cereus]PFP97330.1 hypothetical protein COK02_02555 [Bacillus cereus]PGN52764.1 hypothetical protein CN966_23255 [Bacillus cereus]
MNYERRYWEMQKNNDIKIKEKRCLNLFDLSKKVEPKKIELEEIDISFPVVQIENGFYLHNVLANEIEKILLILDNQRKKNRTLYEKEKKKNEELQNELDALKERWSKFEEYQQEGVGRPKVTDEKTLEIAHKYLMANAKETKDNKRKVNYMKTFRYMQENYGYDGSHVSLRDALREYHANLKAKGKLKIDDSVIIGLAVQKTMRNKINESKSE